MPELGKELGFEEILPEKSVALFDGATKVAITTRFDNDIARGYIEAFAREGVVARLVTGQSGTQDFCFLKHAKNLVAGARSSFAKWAALLGNATKVTFYKMNTTETRNRFGEEFLLIHHHFQRSELRNRIRFVTVTPAVDG